MIGLLVLSGLLATSLWVYSDAKMHADQGRSIIFSAGSLRLDTPVAWFLSCLLLGEFFLPIYVDSRGSA